MSGFMPASSTLPGSKKRRSSDNNTSTSPSHGTLFARSTIQQCPARKIGSTPPTTYPKSVTCY
ncbi:hypothetical protein LTR22_010844, partial [Elasticomyces elasticus]